MQRSVPLDLLPLLKPFKRSGRLALRIEHLPQRAKLSAGRRNSDGSWSLASDELEDLNYLIPSNISAAHELTVRVMKFDDGAASTLKVIQYPIAAWDGVSEPASEDAVRRSSEPNDPILRSQLGEIQSMFAVRETELIELRAALERLRDEKAAELEKARAAWELELNQRLVEAAARVQSDSKRDREVRQSERDGELAAQAEARAEQKLAAERELWQAETDRRIETERQKWLAEADKRVVAELERLKSQTERRIEAERQAWRAESDQRRAVESRHLKAQMDQQLEAERQKWQVEADRRVAVEVERLKELTEQHFEAERQKWRVEADQLVAAELESLKAQLEQRAEAERQTWQAQGDQRVAADIERLKALEEQRIEAERRIWQAEADQGAAADLLRRQAEAEQRIEAERKIWRTEAEQRVEAERRRHQAESLVALSKAEERWKTQEAERSAAARDEWQQQSARLLSHEADKSRRLEATLVAEADKSKKLEVALEALVQAKNVSAPGDETQQLDQLRKELAHSQAALAERDNELVRRRLDAEGERDRWQQEAECSIESAAKALKAEESARVDAAVAKARAQSEEALEDMASRCERAERALAEAGSQSSASPHTDDGYVESLRTEVSELRKALAAQEVELGWARAALDESRPLHLRRVAENLPIGNFEGPAEEQEEPEEDTATKRTLIRDCLLVAGLVVPLVLFYPWIAAYLPDNVQTSIASMTGGLLSAGTEQHATAPPLVAPHPAAPPVQRPTATVSKSVKVRATPALKGTMVVTLQKGASVVVLEQQGSWTHVEVPAKDAAGKPQQGWIYSSYLDAADPNAAKPNTAKPIATNSIGANSIAANPNAAKSNAANLNAASPNAANPTAANPTTANPTAADPNAANPNAADPNAAKSGK